MKLILPVYDRSMVASTAEAAKRHPVIAIINPNEGPGAQKVPGWAEDVNTLREAGATVLCYVDFVGWNKNGDSFAKGGELLKKETARCFDWYGVDGVFLDDLPDKFKLGAKSIVVATEARRRVKLSYANPGCVPDRDYLAVFDGLMIHEGERFGAWSPKWTADFEPGRFAIMATGWKGTAVEAVAKAASYCGALYVNPKKDNWRKGDSCYLKQTPLLNELINALQNNE